MSAAASAAVSGGGGSAGSWSGGDELQRKATYSAYALVPFSIPMLVVMACVYAFGTRRMPLFAGGFGGDAAFWMAMVAGFYGLTLAAMYIPWPEVATSGGGGAGGGDDEDDDDDVA